MYTSKTTIIDRPELHVISYGHGAAYLVRAMFVGSEGHKVWRELFIQDETSLMDFRNCGIPAFLDIYEECFENCWPPEFDKLS